MRPVLLNASLFTVSYLQSFYNLKNAFFKVVHAVFDPLGTYLLDVVELSTGAD
jgi:hypothetical protein